MAARIIAFLVAAVAILIIWRMITTPTPPL